MSTQPPPLQTLFVAPVLKAVERLQEALADPQSDLGPLVRELTRYLVRGFSVREPRSLTTFVATRGRPVVAGSHSAGAVATRVAQPAACATAQPAGVRPAARAAAGRAARLC